LRFQKSVLKKSLQSLSAGTPPQRCGRILGSATPVMSRNGESEARPSATAVQPTTERPVQLSAESATLKTTMVATRGPPPATAGTTRAR
jgi:hypothetical protein